MHHTLRIGGWSLAIASATPAWACTLCHSRLAEDVRAAVLGPDFWSNLAMLAAPAPILAGAVLIVRQVSP